MISYQFQAPFPSEVGRLTLLTELNYETFFGSLPSELGRLDQLTNLQVLYNNLSGEMPTELGLLTNL